VYWRRSLAGLIFISFRLGLMFLFKIYDVLDGMVGVGCAGKVLRFYLNEVFKFGERMCLEENG
jgi:hypothetical protein